MIFFSLVCRTYEGKRWEDLGRPYPHQLPEAMDRFAMTTVGRHIYFVGGKNKKRQIV